MEELVLIGHKVQRFPKTKLPEIDFPNFYVMLDLLAATVYLTHYINPLIIAIILIRKDYSLFGRWLCCFGFINTFGVLTQIVWPTAPPWFEHRESVENSVWTMRGDPADLKNVDKLLNIPFFESLYRANPIVFGAFPSLHVAWSLLMPLFVPVLPSICWTYFALVFWASVYLNHHYLIDGVGAVVYVGFSYFLATKYCGWIYLRHRLKQGLPLNRDNKDTTHIKVKIDV